MRQEARERLNQMIELRTVDETDAAAFRAIWLRALREHPEAFGAAWEEEQQQTVEQIATRLRTELATPESFTLGAFVDRQLVGIVTFRRWTPAKFRHGAMLTGMYVAAQMRGRGVGRMLVAALIARARQLDGLQRIKLAVVTANPAARALYQSLGFESYGVERQAMLVNGQGYDLDWMVLSLDLTEQQEEG